MLNIRKNLLSLLIGLTITGLIISCGGSEDLDVFELEENGKAEKLSVEAVPGELSQTLCLMPAKSSDGRRSQTSTGTFQIKIDPQTAPCPQSLMLQLKLTQGEDKIKVTAINTRGARLYGDSLEGKSLSTSFWGEAEHQSIQFVGFANLKVSNTDDCNFPRNAYSYNGKNYYYSTQNDELATISIEMELLQDNGDEETCVALDAAWMNCSAAIWRKEATDEEMGRIETCEETEGETGNKMTDDFETEICFPQVYNCSSCD